VNDDVYMFEIAFTNGSTPMQRFENEQKARVYVRGFEDGFVSVKTLIGYGIRFNGLIEKVGTT